MADAAHGVRITLERDLWQDGYGRGYQEGRLDGERLGVLALRADLVEHLQQVAYDLRLGLRHDLATPRDAVEQVTALVESCCRG